MDTILGSMAIFGICLLAMALGVILQGKKLSGSCGGASEALQNKGLDKSCGFCVKKENDVCPSSEDNGELVRLATLGAPNRKKKF